MRVRRWGDGLVVFLPLDVVEALNLKEGDEVEVRVARRQEFEISDRNKEEALARIRKLQRPFPPGFKFDRTEIYEEW